MGWRSCDGSNTEARKSCRSRRVLSTPRSIAWSRRTAARRRDVAVESLHRGRWPRAPRGAGPMTPRHDDDDRLWRAIRRVFRLPTNMQRLDRDIDDELRFHIEGRIEELMAAEGLSRANAESEERRRFG